MCIRDSFSADEVYELYEKIVGHLLSLANPSAVETASTPTETKTEDVSTERQNALRIAEDFLSTIPSVSYTHLDVYKRQQ